MLTPRNVRIAMAILMAVGGSAAIWAARGHEPYMASRFAALVAISFYVFVLPQRLIDNLHTRVGRNFALGMIALLAVVALAVGGAVFVIHPAQKAHATWLPKKLRNWCADPSIGRPGTNGPDCQ